MFHSSKLPKRLVTNTPRASMIRIIDTMKRDTYFLVFLQKETTWLYLMAEKPMELKSPFVSLVTMMNQVYW
jgi:hypothetical protein